MRNNIFNERLVKFCLFFILFFSHKNSMAQDQLKLWSLPPDHQLNFPSSSLQNFLNGNYNVPTEKFHNIMYKADGTPWFAIIDDNVVDENGNLLGVLSVSSPALTATNINFLNNASEIAIVPIPDIANEFYIICPGFYFILDMCTPLFSSHTSLPSYPNVSPTQVGSYGSGIAVSELFGSGASSYHLLFLRDADNLYTYKIAQNGISLLSQTAFMLNCPVNNHVTEMECVTMGNGNVLVAFPLPKSYVGPYPTPPCYIAYELCYYVFDQTNGILLNSTNKQVKNTIPWSPGFPYRYMIPKGLEFSPSGDYLFYTAYDPDNIFPGPHLYYVDLTSGIIFASTVDLIIANDADFKKGMIERGQDGNLYFHGGNRLGKLTNPDQPLMAIFTDYAYTFTNPIAYCHYDALDPNDTPYKNIYSLPDQIDGFNYDNAVGNTSPLQITPTSPVTNCVGGNVTLNAGSGYSAYIWSTGATTQTINTNIPGTYTVTVTYACSNTATATTIVSFTTPTISNFVVDDVNCNGGSDGSIIVNTNGGTQPFTYLWSNGQTNSTCTALNAGTYTVTVTDVNGCSVIGSAQVTEPQALSISLNSTSSGCVGQNFGSASALVSGGTQPYSFLWNTGNTTFQITNLAPGNYTVTITDQNSCTIMANTTINELFTPTVNINASPSTTVCEGTPVTLSTVTTGSVTYNWNTTESTSNIIVYTDGNYNVTVSEVNGCTATDQIAITVDQNPDATITGPASSCATGQLYQVPACSGCSYFWSNACAGIVNSPAAASTSVNWGAASLPCILTVSITSQNGACVTGNSIAVNNCCSFSNWCQLNDINASATNASCNGLMNANQIISNKKFIINGTYDVDINLEINDSEILLGQNAKIFVRSGKQLRITNGSYLHACFDMWQGIETEDEFAQVVIDDSRIEDAIDACFAPHKGEFDITASYFDNNLHSVNLNDGQYLSSLIEGNTFECSGTLKPNPGGYTYSDKHIVLNGVDQLIIGSVGGGNNFFDSDFGIYMNYSFVTISGNRFLNNSGNSSSAGIFTDRNSKVRISYNDFIINNLAMHINRTDAEIKFNNITSPNIGILSQLCSRMNLTITDNIILDPLRAGIINFYNHPCIQTIQRNEIIVASNSYNNIQGIVVAEFSPQQIGSTYIIDENNITNVAKGIWLYNLNEPKVINLNGINLVNNALNLVETSGVELSNCYNSTVKYTTVYGNSQGIELSSGIKVDGSQKSAIQCNEIQNVGLGLYWLGNTMKSYMAGNRMTDCFDHVRLESNPGLGLQGVPVNPLFPNGLPLDNQWLGTHLGHETYAKKSSNLILGTTFYVRPLPQPFNPVDNNNDITSIASLVQTVPYAGVNYCVNISPNLMNDNGEELRLATDSIQYYPGEENERWIAKEFLYKRLTEDPILLQTEPVLQQAKDSLDQTNIGELRAIGDSINVILSDSIYETDSLSKAIKIDEIENRNATMPATWDPEYTERFVNEMYLNVIARGINSPDPIQESTLRYLVTLCPYKYGHAVFQARALLAFIDGEFVSYPNICPEEGSQGRAMANSTPKESVKHFSGKLFPNPNSGLMFYQYALPENETKADLLISDMAGREIIRYELIKKESEIILRQQNIQPGVYQYQILSSGGATLDNGKIIIVK